MSSATFGTLASISTSSGRTGYAGRAMCAKQQQLYNLGLSQVNGDQLPTCNASDYQTIYKLAYDAWCSTSCVLLVQHDGEWTPT